MPKQTKNPLKEEQPSLLNEEGRLSTFIVSTYCPIQKDRDLQYI